MRFVGDALALQFFVYAFYFVALNCVANFELAVASVQNLHVIQHAPALYLAVGRFDESEFIDASIAGKRTDQSDVRAFRRFNRANASVVPFGLTSRTSKPARSPGKSAWTQRGKTPLVSDFRKRISLIHELAQL